MARITDNLVVQRVANKLVLVDDTTGSETVISIDDGARLTAMAAYLTNPDDPGRVLTEAINQLKQVGINIEPQVDEHE